MTVIFIFLTSGLFLGWSLGANDAANIFGAAVSTKMIKFRKAAVIASLFVILGAVMEGSGTTRTLGKLGSINALGGAFTVALATAITVTGMTRLRLPVSTSQAIVGAIIGWNFFSGSLTDYSSLSNIVSTWVLCPIIAAIFAIILYHVFKLILKKARIHLLELDIYNRILLILVGAFGAYSLGANNIANVMGVFVPSSPFKPLWFGDIIYITNAQQLFFIGGIAISIGIFSYSYKVMRTVGKDLFKLSPLTGLIVVLAESLVLFIFASKGLQRFLETNNLPVIPLVPVSSSQAVIGAILGIAIAKGGRNINFSILGKISTAWVTTPIIAGIITFFSLFFMQNVFDQQVFKPVEYLIHEPVLTKLRSMQIDVSELDNIQKSDFSNSLKFKHRLKSETSYRSNTLNKIIETAELTFLIIPENFDNLDESLFTPDQFSALNTLKGNRFSHEWQFYDTLIATSDSWRYKAPPSKHIIFNETLNNKFEYLIDQFTVSRKIFETDLS